MNYPQNPPETLKNQPGTLKTMKKPFCSHKNRPGTMKNHKNLPGNMEN